MIFLKTFIVVCGCLLLAGHVAARMDPPRGSQSSVQATQTSKDPYVGTPAYLSFPWTFEAEHAFTYIVNPISSTPTPAPAYAGYTEKLSMLPGHQMGLLLLFKYTNSPIGPYSEILYSPGKHATGCGAESMQHVARIWVDSPFSQRAGRNIWGIPKELATFDWSTGPGWVSVTVKNNNSGKVFFEAKMEDAPIPPALISVAMQLAAAVMPGCVSAVQLPIDDVSGKTEYADVAAYAVDQKAFRSTPMGRVTTQICYTLAEAGVSKVVHSYMDPETWTGRSEEAMSFSIPLALSMPAGATANLTVPVLCQPPAAAAAVGGGVSISKTQQQGAATTAGAGSISFPFMG